jgi:inosose dehydratase
MQQSLPSIQLGIAPLSWQNNVNHNSLNDTMDSISKANFDGCELSQRFPQDPFLLKNSLKQHGIKVSSSQFHSYFTDKSRFNDTINRFLDHMHFLNAIGAKRVIVCECANNTFENQLAPMLENQPLATTAQFRLLVDGLNKIATLAHGAGMQVVYQPRIGTVIHSEQDITKLMQNTDPTMISFLIDMGHFAALDIDAVNVLKTYLDRVNYIYLKDMDKRVLTKAKKERLSYIAAKNAGLFTVLGKGSLDFSRLFGALKTAQYKGWVIAYGTEEFGNTAFTTSAKNTRKFMKVNLGI